MKYIIKLSFVSCVLCLISFAGCKHGTSNKQAELAKLKKQKDDIENSINKLETEIADTSGERIKYVAVNVIKPQEFNHYLEVQGRIDGDENVAVSSKMAGVVTKIFVKEGDEVKDGQILAQLDDEVLKKNLNELNSSLDFANQMYEKQKNLWDKKIGSEVQYLTAKNNKESLEDKVSTLKGEIDMTKIKSPINGSVEEIPIKIGQAVSPGLSAFRVINFSHVKVVADLADAYAAKIKLGDEVLVNIPDLNKEFKANITFSSTYINPVNRTFQVEVRLNPTHFVARANMLAIIKINDYRGESAFVVPINLVQKSLDKQYIVIAKKENNKILAHKQDVTVGSIYNGLAEIKTGLNTGDKVITAGYQDLNEGQLLNIEN